MIFLLPLILPALTGYLTMRILTLNSKEEGLVLYQTSLALPLGFGLNSLLTFLSYIIIAEHAKGLSLTLSVLLTGILVYLNRDIFKSLKLPSLRISLNLNTLLTIAAGIFFLITLIFYIRYFLSGVSWNIYGGWDARFFWNLKAKFFYRTPELWTGMFASFNPWAHPDYPLMLPATVAGGWNTLGKEALFWPPVVDLCFFLSLAGLIFAFLSARAGKAAAFIAASFLIGTEVFRFWSTTQYADIPLSVFFTASVVFLFLAHRDNNSSLYFLSGLFAGLSGWTKNEGLFFVMWTSALCLFLVLSKRELPLKSKARLLVFLILGIALPLSATIYLKAFLGVSGGEYLGSGRGAERYLELLFGDFSRTKFILLAFYVICFVNKQWAGLWILFVISLLFGLPKSFRRKTWIFPIIVLMIQGGYIAIMHVTPYDLKMQIETALLRLILQTAPLALIFIFDTFCGRTLNHEKS